MPLIKRHQPNLPNRGQRLFFWNRPRPFLSAKPCPAGGDGAGGHDHDLLLLTVQGGKVMHQVLNPWLFNSFSGRENLTADLNDHAFGALQKRLLIIPLRQSAIPSVVEFRQTFDRYAAPAL